MLYSSPVPAHSQSMLYSSPVPAHSYYNVTANCTVGRDWEALLLFGGQNAFNINYIKKLAFPFYVPHRIDYMHCLCHLSSTHLSHYKTCLCTGYLQPNLQYRIYTHKCSKRVTECKIYNCGVKNSKVETEFMDLVNTKRGKCNV
jgi:hypothetical protein